MAVWQNRIKGIYGMGDAAPPQGLQDHMPQRHPGLQPAIGMSPQGGIAPAPMPGGAGGVPMAGDAKPAAVQPAGGGLGPAPQAAPVTKLPGRPQWQARGLDEGQEPSDTEFSRRQAMQRFL